MTVPAHVENMFTGPKGGKMTRWTNLSLQKQLSVIADAGEIDVRAHAFALTHLYEEGSEALHGTLYGAVSHLGALEGVSPEDAERHRSLNAVNVSVICSRMLSATVAAYGAGPSADEAKARMDDRNSKIIDLVSRFLDGSNRGETEA